MQYQEIKHLMRSMGKPAFVGHAPVVKTRRCGIQEERPLDDQKTGNSNWERGRGI